MNEVPARWSRFGRAQRRKSSGSTKVWLSGCVAALLVVAAFYVPRRVQAEARAVSVESLGDLPARAQAAGRLIVATYNVAHSRGGEFGASNWSGGTTEEKIRRLEAIGRLLDSRGVQIAVVNEVDFDCTWSGRTDQAEVIARAGGYPHLARQRNVDVALPFFRAVFGNAVLSRFPITEARLVPFEPRSPFERRVAGNHDSVIARVRLAPGAELSIWAVHLEHRSPAIRQLAAQRILKRAATIADPLVVAGDLNSRLDEGTPSDPRRTRPSAIGWLLASSLFRSFPAPEEAPARPTFPSSQPDRTIDWILFPAGWELASGDVPSVTHSDHLPVLATFVLPNSRPTSAPLD